MRAMRPPFSLDKKSADTKWTLWRKGQSGEGGEGPGFRDEDLLRNGETEADNVIAAAEAEARLTVAASQQQTMAGVEINSDSDEFQGYQSFTRFSQAAIFDS